MYFRLMRCLSTVRQGRHRFYINIANDKYYSSSSEKKETPKIKAFRQKLREKTPIGKLDPIEGQHPHQEKDPLPPWPNNTNPHTGEINGPKGPEPTRYGDWERKGRVSDF